MGGPVGHEPRHCQDEGKRASAHLPCNGSSSWGRGATVGPGAWLRRGEVGCSQEPRVNLVRFSHRSACLLVPLTRTAMPCLMPKLSQLCLSCRDLRSHCMSLQ